MLNMKYLFFLCMMHCLYSNTIAEQFKDTGYIKLNDKKEDLETFDSLYTYFDELTEFLQTHPIWEKKLYAAKERFIRLKDKNVYSSEVCGFYDESKIKQRCQISFYYSTEFHQFICANYPELSAIPQITYLFEACLKIKTAYQHIFTDTVTELGLKPVLVSEDTTFPILIKVVKYLPSYFPTRPHYDGSTLTLLLDSTNTQSLLLSPYKSSFIVDDFTAPLDEFSRKSSILLIPGSLLTEFSIFPTPHIIAASGKTRYATVAFAMRSHYQAEEIHLSSLPNFDHR